MILHSEPKAAEPAETRTVIFWTSRNNAASHSNPKSGHTSQAMSLNDLEFAYAPVRDQVRDLREYL
jgi:hypothetical protein